MRVIYAFTFQLRAILWAGGIDQLASKHPWRQGHLQKEDHQFSGAEWDCQETTFLMQDARRWRGAQGCFGGSPQADLPQLRDVQLGIGALLYSSWSLML